MFEFGHTDNDTDIFDRSVAPPVAHPLAPENKTENFGRSRPQHLSPEIELHSGIKISLVSVVYQRLF